MSGTGVVVLNTVVAALGLDLVEHGLELANDGHVAVDAHHVLFGVDLQLFLEGLVVLTNRNVLKVDVAGIKGFAGIDILTLRHGFLSPYKIFT